MPDQTTERLAQIACALSQFVAKPGVLDRNRRWLGSGSESCDLWRNAALWSRSPPASRFARLAACHQTPCHIRTTG